jgi:hypothetical protein
MERLYGALLLTGAMAAAYQGDPITSRALLNEAATTARRLGIDANHAYTAFGPTNVGVHRVSAAVALGDGGAVIQHARAVHPVQLPMVERRASTWWMWRAATARPAVTTRRYGRC